MAICRRFWKTRRRWRSGSGAAVEAEPTIEAAREVLRQRHADGGRASGAGTGERVGLVRCGHGAVDRHGVLLAVGRSCTPARRDCASQRSRPTVGAKRGLRGARLEVRPPSTERLRDEYIAEADEISTRYRAGRLRRCAISIGSKAEICLERARMQLGSADGRNRWASWRWRRVTPRWNG